MKKVLQTFRWNTSSGSGVASDSARQVAGTAKKRLCLGSADALNEVVERRLQTR